jgi:hypothetical protein
MTQYFHSRAEAVTLPERISWALNRLEIAARRLADDPFRSPLNVECVAARYSELERLRELEKRAS